jgi:hypothetical protein
MLFRPLNAAWGQSGLSACHRIDDAVAGVQSHQPIPPPKQ